MWSHMNRLFKFIPKYYFKSKVVKNIFNVCDDELKSAEEMYCILERETLVGESINELKRWERQFGIKSDYDKTMVERRAIVRAKRMGRGTSTKDQIKKVCLTFVNDVEIVEHNKESWFEINIILNGELPYKLDSLYTVIEEIKPAHLDVKFNLITINNGKLHVGTANLTLETTTIYPQEVFL
ncbi:DUF2313 domain-containing protein [Clostridium botulinum]|nr:DUF2313 domain-containing protein [Clostridium botulinum]